MNHLTIATSTGLVWLMLVSHFGAGLLALVAGGVALSVAKGGRLHKQTGMLFMWAMITTGVLASAIAVYERKWNMILGGLFTAYLAFTAVSTVKPSFRARWSDVALMIFAFAYAAVSYSTPATLVLDVARAAASSRDRPHTRRAYAVPSRLRIHLPPH